MAWRCFAACSATRHRVACFARESHYCARFGVVTRNPIASFRVIRAYLYICVAGMSRGAGRAAPVVLAGLRWPASGETCRAREAGRAATRGTGARHPREDSPYRGGREPIKRKECCSLGFHAVINAGRVLAATLSRHTWPGWRWKGEMDCLDRRKSRDAVTAYMTGMAVEG